MKRRLFVASTVSAALAACAPLTNALNDNGTIHDALTAAEGLNHAVIGTHGSAKLYPDSAITTDYPMNGNPTPSDPVYTRLAQSRFAGYRLAVGGQVERPQSYDLRQLRALATLSQNTRHDCVEGWSVVGKWRGVPVATILRMARPKAAARYVVFRSFDRDQNGVPFYGSLDVREAAHPQTQLALDFNGRPVTPDYGGPVRLRVPTQLAYKSTKWVHTIELVSSFAHIGEGHGGYWEDNGYEWFAGI